MDKRMLLENFCRSCHYHSSLPIIVHRTFIFEIKKGTPNCYPEEFLSESKELGTHRIKSKNQANLIIENSKLTFTLSVVTKKISLVEI